MNIDELASAAGTRTRTVRFYIAEGLLPGPDGQGRAARYTEDHLARLRAILRLREKSLPLSEIRRAIQGVSTRQLGEVTGNALAYIDSLLAQTRPAFSPHALPSMASPPAGHAVMEETALAMRMPESRSAPHRRAPSGEQWRRIRLHPDVELNIREPMPPGLASRLDGILELLRRALEGKE